MKTEQSTNQAPEGQMDWGTEEEVLDFSRLIALRVRRTVDRDLALDDLISWGLMGYLEVREKYGESPVGCWRKLVYWRTYGAMMDGARRWSQSSHGKTLVARDRRRQEGNTPGQERAASSPYVFESFLEADQAGERESTSEGNDVVDKVDQEILLRSIARISCSLSLEERVLLELIYVFEMGTREIGELMGKSKSWVSRKHHGALKTLRRKVERSMESARERKRRLGSHHHVSWCSHSSLCDSEMSSDSPVSTCSPDSRGCDARIVKRGRSGCRLLSATFMGPSVVDRGWESSEGERLWFETDSRVDDMDSGFS